MERESMVFYKSFYEAIKSLPPEEFKKCAVALLEYGLNGTEPETEGIEKTVYIMAKPQIDKNNQRYINGKNGGRPNGNQPNSSQSECRPNGNQPNSNQSKASQSITKPMDNQTITEQEPDTQNAEPNVNVNDNDNDNANVNVNVNDNANDNAKGNKEKSAKRSKRKTGADAPVCVFFPLDEKLNEAFLDFMKMRKKIGRPMTDRAITLMVSKINALGDNNLAIDCLNESILHCWQDIYPNKRASPKDQQIEKSSNPFMDMYDRLIEEENYGKNRNSEGTCHIEDSISEILL